MSLAADALQPFIVRGLTDLQGRPSGVTLPDLVGKQRTIGYDLSFNDASRTILVDFRDARVVVNAIASDSARLASASFQTIATASKDITGTGGIAWGLIRSYYGAFYAGHALTRLFGESCSYFDRNHITRISMLGAALGQKPGFKLESGMYRCLLNRAATALECANLRAGGGGTHELFWNVFGGRIKNISEEVLLGALAGHEAQLVFSKVDALTQSIRGYGAPLHSWLSVIRNEIQYRHNFGVWFPCEVRKRDRERLGRLVDQWTRDPMTVDIGAAHFGQLGEFVVTCAFIVSLCRVLWMRIAERSTRSDRSIATLGPIASLKQAKPG
jgi:hypothetical protein